MLTYIFRLAGRRNHPLFVTMLIAFLAAEVAFQRCTLHCKLATCHHHSPQTFNLCILLKSNPTHSILLHLDISIRDSMVFPPETLFVSPDLALRGLLTLPPETLDAIGAGEPAWGGLVSPIVGW